MRSVLASSYRIRMGPSRRQLMRTPSALILPLALLIACGDEKTITNPWDDRPECGDVGWTPGCQAG